MRSLKKYISGTLKNDGVQGANVYEYKEKEISLKTPRGVIAARKSHLIYPGTLVQIDRDTVSLVEYVPEEKQIYVRAWPLDCSCDPEYNSSIKSCETCKGE